MHDYTMIAVLLSTFVPTADHICLIGERNSGTNFFEGQLAECFGRGNVEPRYTRWKHWFQERDTKEGLLRGGHCAKPGVVDTLDVEKTVARPESP